MSGEYDDIIGLPHPVSAKHPRMSLENRAAQFSPFAALTGYEAAIAETGRLTGERVELAEGTIAALDMKLGILAERIADRPEAAITYFQPDALKQGGTYVTVTCVVKKVDDTGRALVLANGDRIPIADILEIEWEGFGDSGRP